MHVLQAKKTKTQPIKRCSPSVAQTAPAVIQNHNRYALLGSSPDNYKDGPIKEDTISTISLEADYDAQIQTAMSDEDLPFIDDDIGEWIELSYFISVGCISTKSHLGS